MKKQALRVISLGAILSVASNAFGFSWTTVDQFECRYTLTNPEGKQTEATVNPGVFRKVVSSKETPKGKLVVINSSTLKVNLTDGHDSFARGQLEFEYWFANEINDNEPYIIRAVYSECTNARLHVHGAAYGDKCAAIEPIDPFDPADSHWKPVEVGNEGAALLPFAEFNRKRTITIKVDGKALIYNLELKCKVKETHTSEQ